MIEPAVEPGDALVARLDDPKTAEALNQILDHVDLLAVIVTGLSGFVSRGDTIADTLAEGMRDVTALNKSTGVDVAGLLDAGKQFGAAAPQLLDALPGLLDALPMLEQLASSGIADPQVIDLLSTVARSAVTGAQQAQGQSISGAFALLRALKDDDVARALGFIVSIAKALGQQLDGRPLPGGGKHADRPSPT